MNNLHRELAPISESAWQEIEDEATRSFKRNSAGRRLVDVNGPLGLDTASVTLGSRAKIDSPADGISAFLRQTQPLVELKVPVGLKPGTALPIRAEVDWLACTKEICVPEKATPSACFSNRRYDTGAMAVTRAGNRTKNTKAIRCVNKVDATVGLFFSPKIDPLSKGELPVVR